MRTRPLDIVLVLMLLGMILSRLNNDASDEQCTDASVRSPKLLFIEGAAIHISYMPWVRPRTLFTQPRLLAHKYIPLPVSGLFQMLLSPPAQISSIYKGCSPCREEC
jgi:hypothetical protein